MLDRIKIVHEDAKSVVGFADGLTEPLGAARRDWCCLLSGQNLGQFFELDCELFEFSRWNGHAGELTEQASLVRGKGLGH